MTSEVLEDEISEISIDNIGVNEEIETYETQEHPPESEKPSATPVDGQDILIDALLDQTPAESLETIKTFQCKTCSKSFDEMRKLARHMKSHNRNRIKCEECGKFLKSRSSWNSHRLRHEQGKRFECEVCRKRFAAPKDLKTHYKVHEEKTERFRCDECGKDFGRIYTLLDHQRLHSGKEVFSCDKCDKVFPKRRNLLLHERSHLVEEEESK
ncbi:gastrula zinc finger protein XlCGF67.1 [Aedes albopictus]|uniref:C2H2-type domain-containing protein n=1 Tax=Aedes albopictus TaxID=7160 RepID=A0ABM1XQI1_AEDAL